MGRAITDVSICFRRQTATGWHYRGGRGGRAGPRRGREDQAPVANQTPAYPTKFNQIEGRRGTHPDGLIPPGRQNLLVHRDGANPDRREVDPDVGTLVVQIDVKDVEDKAK